MIEAMVGVFLTPALSPIGSVPPLTRPGIVTFYSRRDCAGRAIGTASEGSSRFEMMKRIYPSYRRSDHTCINSRASSSARSVPRGGAQGQSRFDDGPLVQPPVIVPGTRPPPPSTPNPPAITPENRPNIPLTPPLEGQPDDTLEDELASNECQQQESEVDAEMQTAVSLIEVEVRRRAAAGLPPVEFGFSVYRDAAGNVHLSRLYEGTPPPPGADIAGSVSIGYPHAATAAAGGEVLGYIHNHYTHPVPGTADWGWMETVVSRGDANRGVIGLYILYDGQLYEFNDGDQIAFTQRAGQPPVEPQPNSVNFARNGEFPGDCGLSENQE